MATPEQFAQQYGDIAANVGKRLGVDPTVLLGQWGLETGWGKSVIPGTNNLGNIKDFSGSGVGATDNMTGSVDKYRQFSTPDDFANHYTSLITRKYPNAVGSGNDAQAFAKALKAGGYAEDPDYIEKIASTTGRVRRDPGIIERFANAIIPAAQAGTLDNEWSALEKQFSGQGVQAGKANDPWAELEQKFSSNQPAQSQTYSDGKGDRVIVPEQPNINKPKPLTKETAKQAIADSLKSPFGDMTAAQGVAGTAAGLGQGVGQVALGAQHWAGRGLQEVGATTPGDWLVNDAAQGRENLEQQVKPFAENAPFQVGAGRIAGNVAATLPVGGLLGGAVKSVAPALGPAAPQALKLAEAIKTGGMSLGGNPATSTLGQLGNMAARSAGGAITGAATTGLVNPEDAKTGAVIGAFSPFVIKTAGDIGSKLYQNRQNAISDALKNAPRNQTIKDANAVGYVIPPSSVNPSFKNNVMESISGKIATAQKASEVNQAVTDSLARKALGLSDTAPLTKEALSAYRTQAFNDGYEPLRQLGAIKTDQSFNTVLDDIATAYKGKGTIPAIEKSEIAALVNAHKSEGFDSSDAIDAIRILRENANDAFKAGNTALGKTSKAIADAYEGQLGRLPQLTQSPEMLTAYTNARANIAKSFTVQDAIKDGTGNVDARSLAKALQKGMPLTDELAIAAKFANAFPKAAQPPSFVAGAGVHNIKALASGLAGIGGASVAGPVGAAASVLPFIAPPIARARLFSKALQSTLGESKIPTASMYAYLLRNPQAANLLQKSAPVLGAQR